MARNRKPARLFQRKDDGAWLILDQGKQFRTGYGAGQHREAEGALKEYLVEKEYRDSTPRSNQNITFGQIIARYVHDSADKMACPDRLIYAVNALAPFWGDKPVSTMTSSLCKEYLKLRNVAPDTVRRELGVLQAAVNHSHREGILNGSVQVTLPEKGKAKERYLTRDEIAALLRNSPNYLRRFILISVYTGRRKSAVLNLRWQESKTCGWVDINAGKIHFLGSKLSETKKKKGSISVPINLLGHLRRWHDPRAEGVITYAGHCIKDVKRAFAKACQDAGIEGATPHTLKHTAVTLGFQSGLKMEDATAYFATSPETLNSVYRQHSPESHQAALGPMSALGKRK